MLDNVNDVDWAGKGHPNIPELLSQLASNDRYKQAHARNQLESDVVLGGENWQDFDRGYGIELVFQSDVIIHLIPFLIELLDSDGVSNRSLIFTLLAGIHHYKNMHDEKEVYKERVIDVNNVLWSGREVYLKLLSDSDLKVRKGALSVLMGFDEPTQYSETYNLVARRFEPKIASDDS